MPILYSDDLRRKLLSGARVPATPLSRLQPHRKVLVESQASVALHQARTLETLEQATATVTPQNAAKCFRHCGYGL